MLRHSSRHGHGHGHTRLATGLTFGNVPIRESEPMNQGVVESFAHEMVQQALENVLNIDQSFDWLAQIMTTVV